MKIEKNINLIELLTLVALITGGIFGYFLNKRYDALLANSNIRLNEIQTEISEIDKMYRKAISVATINEKNQGVLESSAVTQLNEIKKRIYRLEEEHKMKLEHFEKTMGDSFEEHEIWFEWKSLVELKENIEEELRELRKTLKEIIKEI